MAAERIEDLAAGRLPKSHAGASPVFLYELYTSSLKSTLKHVESGIAGFRCAGFELAHRNDADARRFSQSLL